MQNSIPDFQFLKEFLDEKADFYNHPDFIPPDPISIPHRFSLKQDIEIAAFLTATISWGTRKSIINDACKIVDWMENSPFEFVTNFKDSDMAYFRHSSVHRTFNREDLRFFVHSLKRIYTQHSSMEDLFLLNSSEDNFYHAIERFRKFFLEDEPEHRGRKHLSSPYKNSAAKRLMMFLRWMVRRDSRGVDFGLWKSVSPSHLSVPLDVHTGNISRQLALITRKQNDWKTVMEMDAVLRKFDASDPAKYDFALFGLGIDKQF